MTEMFPFRQSLHVTSVTDRLGVTLENETNTEPVWSDVGE